EKLQAQLRSVEEALSPEGTGGRSQPESRDDQPGRSKPPGEYNPGDIREADNLTESEGIPGYKSTGEIGSTTIIGNGTSSVNSPVSDGSDNSVSVQNTDETVIIQDREDVLPQKKRPPVRAANKNSIRPEEPTSTAERENTLGPDDFQEQTVSGSLRKNHDIEDSNYDANLKKGRTQNGKFFERTVIPPEKLLELAVCFLEELADRWHILQPASFSTSEWQELDIRHLTVDEGIRLFEKNAVQENPDINDFLAENVRELIKQMISRYSPHNKEELPSAPDSGSVDFDKTTTTSAGESLSIPNAGPEALAALIGMVIHGEGPDPVNPDFHTGEKPQLDIATMASGCASLPEREETESGSPPSPKAVRQLKESLKAFLAEYLRVEEADLQSSPVSATAVTEEQSSTGSCAPLFSPDEILEIVVESLINILWQQNEVIPDRESRTSTQKTGSEPVTGSDNNLYSETASRYQTEGKPILTPEQITRLRALLKVSIDNTADSSEEVQASEASTNFVSSTDVGALPVNIHQEMTEIIADIENVLSSSQLSPAAVAGLLPVIHSISERISVQEIKNRWKEMEELLQTIVKSEQSPHVFQPGKTADIIPEYRFENTDSVYFNNAGLVILWPLLEHFFAVLGLVKEGRFIDIIASERAVHILQYLVNEATETSEHELTLNKILCGLRQTDPVPRKIVLTKEDIEEADNLLRAVISNWPALGTISVDGFRAAFLQRQGMLTRRNGDWLVQVERQTHDILMDKLDWVISVIKLPWLDCLISVEW
ncbi:MAG: hypothetical protein JW712_03660, partial [Dehalococcoidales bacterium]|nr:hypothetical protein [Dehalococcoidales bacterium]